MEAFQISKKPVPCLGGKLKISYRVKTHIRSRQYRRRFPRLKVIAYDINEIWSIDLAYVDKLAKYKQWC